MYEKQITKVFVAVSVWSSFWQAAVPAAAALAVLVWMRLRSGVSAERA